MPVNSPRKDYEAILPKWNRLRDCFGGRDAVLRAGNLYVPDLPGAPSANANKDYRERGNFLNALKRTVQGLNGMIFQEAPEVELKESLKPMLDDITLTNVPFESFAAEAGKEVFLIGRYGVLIDMPQALTPEAVTAGAVAREPADMRPYCIGYNAEHIINWRTQRRGGDEILTMVVLKEHAEIPNDKDDPYVCKTIEQFRVVMLNEFGQCITQIWRLNAAGDKYERTPEGDVVSVRLGEALTFVPFVFLGALATGPDLEHPPLLDVADVNLAHWRNSVDYEYGLHLIALPTPWIAGGKGNGNEPLKFGPSVALELDANGSAGMLEFTGQGLSAFVVAMDEKKKQMAMLGARLMEDTPTINETATAVRMRHTGETASLKTIAQALEMGFTQVLQFCAWWAASDAKSPSETEVNVELNKEYLQIRAQPQEIQTALTALQAGEMAFETWYALLQSGGWAREGVDAATEQADINKRKVDTNEPPADPSQE